MMFFPRRIAVGFFALCLLGLGPGRSLGAQATDRASNHSFASIGVEAWQNNTNRADALFGVWELASNPNAGAAGHFIGDSTIACGDINSQGKSFGLYANPSLSPAPTASAVRKFAQPVLRTGDSISFRVAVNQRNGNKGISLRNAMGEELWTFHVGRNAEGEEGYFIRNGASGSASDNGQRLGGYDANTVFTFSFTQHPRRVNWRIQREGGISSSLAGILDSASGTIADVKFFIIGTEAAGTEALRAANNLYFNEISFASEPRGDAPLTIGERRYPGLVPSHTLRFEDPVAASATVRTSVDNFATAHPMAKTSEGLWEIDIRSLNLARGHHSFRFDLDGEPEPGESRHLFIDAEGRLAKPRAVYLEWIGDPSTSMVVHWHNYDPAGKILRHRRAGSEEEWTRSTATTVPFPFTERLVHTAEITGLQPATDYEFRVDGYEETFRFRTMPETLENPVTFGIGGDVDIGPTADAMTAAIASKNPDFLAVIGDLAYADGRADQFWKWYRYWDSWFENARTPDGRLIPKVVGIGNHEVRHGYAHNHPDFDNSPEWRLRQAPFFHRFFSSPGHRVLDFGDYLSLVILDTDHSHSVLDQAPWLASVLEARRGRPHLVPAYHVPAYTSFRLFDEKVSERIRRHWVPLFEKAGVRIAFEHHDHTFSRTKPLLGGVEHPDGIRYFGDGLWGIDPRPPDTSRWYLETANQTHHVHLVTLTKSGRSVEAVDAQGAFFGGRIEQAVDRD